MTRVWDLLLRFFHWSLVAAYAIAWLTADEWDRAHEIVGYAIAALIAVRLVWGLIGSRYARFASFVTGPRATLDYLGAMARGKEPRYLGHNPAGAAMIVALLLSLSGTILTGWLMTEPSRLALLPEMPSIAAAAWAGDDDGDEDRDGGSELVKDLHEVAANLTLFLVALHVAGVLLASKRHHENLARAMLTGDKRAPGPGDIA